MTIHVFIFYDYLKLSRFVILLLSLIKFNEGYKTSKAKQN